MTTAIFCAYRRGIFSRALILALLFAAVLPFGAFADEGTPPPPTEEPAPPPEEGGEVAEEPVVEEPIVEELVVEVPVVDKPVLEEFAALLAELPVETEIVILSEDGEPLPMISTEAAEVIVSGDPMWCPVGVNPGGVGCSINYPSLSDLIAGMTPTANGVIWIQGGIDTGGDATIDGGDFGNWHSAATFSLTLKGGWNGCSPTCVSTTNPNNPSIFDTRILITNWGADVTLTDIVMTGSISDLPALEVVTKGKITLTRVDSSNNDGTGAYLDNSGAEGKDVTVSFGEYENNGDGDANEYGLQIFSKGVITLSSIKANWNGAYGAYLGNSGAGTPKNVILTSGYFEFNNNGGNGLSVDSKGLISLKDIDAIHNGITGVVLSNVASPTNQGVTLSGMNIFGENGLSGLNIGSKGAITISNLVANSNLGASGAYLDNSSWGPGIYPITLTGSNEAKFNITSGLEVYSNGAITISNLTATNNSTYGAYLDNRFSSTGQSVTLSGVNIFDYNWAFGLVVKSKGVISLSNIQARNNSPFSISMGGVSLDNHLSTLPKAVTLTGINSFSDNANIGLYVLSKGAITVNNICSAENSGGGAYLYNDYEGAVGGVTVTGTAGFTSTGGGFFDNGNTGLEIWSRGAVTLKDMDAINNGVYGIYINNAAGTGNVSVGTSIMPWRFGLLENGQSGIEIYTRGSISLNRVAATNNDGDGAILYNMYDGIAKPVTITTSSSDDLSRADFSSNGGNGLTVQSHGTITIAHLNASDNGWGTSGGYGALLDNCGFDSGLGACTTFTPAAVTLTGDNKFSWNLSGFINSGFGLKISSKGAITLNNVNADNNDVYGAILENDYPGALGGITVGNSATYWPTFNENEGGSGLEIQSRGTVVLKDFDAIGNAYFGVYIDNNNGTGNVTVGTSRTYWMNGVWTNGYSGIEIYSHGSVIVWDIWGQDNLDYGIYIDNTGAGPKPVTFNASSGSHPYSNTSSGNGLSGFYILTEGSIAINKIEAWGNGWDASPDHDLGAGVYLENCGYDTFSQTCTGNPLLPQNVTLNGVNLGENFYSGIEVHTYGAILASNVSSEGNGHGELLTEDKYGYGALFYNDYGALPRTVTLNGTNVFEGNWNDGLTVSSLDAIKVNNLEAWYNGEAGAILYNADAGMAKTVTLTGYGDFGENGSSGLIVESKGTITMANLYANSNGWTWGGDGVSLDNCQDVESVCSTVSPANIVLTGNSGFYGNSFTGLYATSIGSISISNLRASENAGHGAYLINGQPGSTSSATITLTGTQHMDFNSGNGLELYTKKAVTINNLYAEGNGFNGAFLNNIDSGPSSPQNVTLTGSNSFDGNDMTGLVVYSYGAISINNLFARNNGLVDGGSGAWIDNCIYDSFLDQCLALTPKPISLTGLNVFYHNQEDGLDAVSIGSITINNIGANANGVIGAYLDNQWEQLMAGGFVTLTGSNAFKENGSSGLEVHSHGNITLSNVTAILNGEDGAYLDNYGISGPQVKVTLTGSNTFNSNGDWLAGTGNGLVIFSEGNITINNLTANWNGGNGAHLDNLDRAYQNPILTLTGMNTFLGNQFAGLVINAWSTVSLSKVRADDNGGTGVDVYSEAGGITIACGSMTHNGNYGWYLDAGTSITLKAVVALGNGINTWSNVTPIPFRSC